MNRKNEPVSVEGLSEKPLALFFDMTAASKIQQELKFNPLGNTIEFIKAAADPEKLIAMAVSCLGKAAPSREDLTGMITTYAQLSDLSNGLVRARAHFFGVSDEDFDTAVAKIAQLAKEAAEKKAAGEESPLAETKTQALM